MGLFNRPKSTATTSSSDGPADMFSHTQSYSAILAEQEQRRKEKAENRMKKEEKRKRDEGVEESPPKRKKRETSRKKSEDAPRRRITGQDIGNLLGEAGVEEVDVESEGEGEIVMEESGMGIVRGKPTRSSSRISRKGEVETEAIEVGGSSGDEVQMNGSSRLDSTAPAEEEDDESDEELAALARQARQRRLQRTQAATPDATNNLPRPTSGSPYVEPQGAPLPDPPVQILVVSNIPNTKPLMVYRKLSQNLREIRLAWCKRQGFDEAFTERVFLVHRKRKVYDVTTCRSLGLQTDADGNVTMEGAEGKEGVDQVALEAVTQDIYDRILHEKEREDAKRRTQWDTSTKPGAEDEPSTEQPVEEEFIGLVLKAKGKPDFKLKVKPVSQPLSPTNHIIAANIITPDHTFLQDHQRVQKDLPRAGRQQHRARL
jgi:hypothetical protein